MSRRGGLHSSRSDASRRCGARAAWRGAAAALVHACNSAGLALYPEAFSLVAPASGLRPLQVGGEAPLEQLQSLRLVTRLLSVQELPAGQGVGYGQTWSTGSQPRRVGLVALGYADGYPWSLSGRGWMSIRGRRCEVLGRVSMDVITLDLSALDGCSLAPGEEVVVFGGGTGEPDLLTLAQAAGTLPYELLTRISPRVRRVYLRGR